MLFCHSIWHSFWHSLWHSFWIYCGIHFGIRSGILPGMYSCMHSGLLAGILCDILFWQSGIYSDILSDIGTAGPQPRAPDLSWVRQCRLGSGARGWGPAVLTEIWSLRLRSGSAHWHLELVGLRSGTAHWHLEFAVEEQEKKEEEKKENEDEKEKATLIKSRGKYRITKISGLGALRKCHPYWPLPIFPLLQVCTYGIPSIFDASDVCLCPRLWQDGTWWNS